MAKQQRQQQQKIKCIYTINRSIDKIRKLVSSHKNASQENKVKETGIENRKVWQPRKCFNLSLVYILLCIWTLLKVFCECWYGDGLCHDVNTNETPNSSSPRTWTLTAVNGSSSSSKQKKYSQVVDFSNQMLNVLCALFSAASKFKTCKIVCFIVSLMVIPWERARDYRKTQKFLMKSFIYTENNLLIFWRLVNRQLRVENKCLIRYTHSNQEYVALLYKKITTIPSTINSFLYRRYYNPENSLCKSRCRSAVAPLHD